MLIPVGIDCRLEECLQKLLRSNYIKCHPQTIQMPEMIQTQPEQINKQDTNVQLLLSDRSRPLRNEVTHSGRPAGCHRLSLYVDKKKREPNGSVRMHHIVPTTTTVEDYIFLPPHCCSWTAYCRSRTSTSSAPDVKSTPIWTMPLRKAHVMEMCSRCQQSVEQYDLLLLLLLLLLLY